MATNIKAIFATSTSTIDSIPGRLRGYSIINGMTSATDIVLRDGGSTGSVIMQQRVLAGGSSDQYIEDGGIRYQTNLHVTMNAGVSVTGTFFTG
tara:strand:- start:543 stop:824 length:282 start_codon:yes stop_codon:yes gene_type:complete